MYLKRLDLHGFKSFASTTAFEFGPGVTCIAGPNGSGKTNVAEAIRWVLGEQASRTMRARKTEDIIFSGSAKRPQLGMADVRITLDNTDGWLPVDFEEVVVSRRAYRSGENEYYLNGNRVRLKDLNELFLKAEIGQNSYAFMGQGLVDQVLTLRPEERRAFIEEAADVRLHRDRLDEARSRLAATQENLTRVDLVVREIEPRLRQLERQAGRAETYVRLSAELADLLQTLYGQQWQNAQEALAAARAAADQRNGAFESGKREIAQFEDGLVSIAAAIEDQRRDIGERETAYSALIETQRELQRRLSFDEERGSMLIVRREELVGEIDALQHERDELRMLIAEQEEREQALAGQLEAARVPDAASREMESAEWRLRELRGALADVERRAAETSACLAEAEGRSSAIVAQRERAESQLASSDATRREEIESLKAWGREAARRRQELLAVGPRAAEASAQLADAERRFEYASATVARRQDEVRSLDLQIRSAEVRLEAAEGTDAELPSPDAGVKAVLAAGGLVPGQEPSDDSRIKGVLGVVGQLIRVPAGLERAIEAALADSLHALVVQSQEDALAAAELLISEDLGRAAVYPLNDMQASHPVNLMEERGVVGVASDLVRCDHKYRPLVNALLGRTIVAQNLGIAKMLLRRGLGSVVTLDGILLRPVGSISAGSTKVVRHAFVHQREVGDLPQELERLRAAHREAIADLEARSQELTEAQKQQEQLAPEVARLQPRLAKAEASIHEHRSRLRGIALRLSTIHAQRRNALRLLDETEAVLRDARHDVEQAKRDSQVLDAERARLGPEIEEAAAEREAIAGRAGLGTGRVAGLEAETESLRQQRRLQDASLSRAEQELSRRVETAAKLDGELAEIQGRTEAARQELAEKSQAAEAAREELEPARHALEQLESRQRSLTDELAAARSRVLEAERSLLEAENAVQLRGEEIEVLRARFDEEGFRPTEAGVQPVDDDDAPPSWLVNEPGGDGEAPPPIRGATQVDVATLKDRVSELRASIRRLGPVNEQAETDFVESRERYEYLSGQLKDLRDAEASLLQAIEELEAIVKERFSATYRKVNEAFQRYFASFFGGGHAELTLTKEDENGLPGVDIVAQPPRKRVRSVQMLSGGERSLTALALLFALLDTHPSPICVLDEVDAALDESNVGRFTAELRELSQRTQFIIITHNRRTLEMADTIYGISMGEDSTSSVLSLRLADIPAK